MKIKDILNPAMSLRDKYIIAHRLRRCSGIIKSDIRKWKETNELPDRIVVLDSPAPFNERMTLSYLDLVEIYNFNILEAFLFMDDILKASTKKDKCRLIELLYQLKSTGCIHQANITDELLDQIREEQPGVWKRYQELLMEEGAGMRAIEQEDSLNKDI